MKLFLYKIIQINRNINHCERPYYYFLLIKYSLKMWVSKVLKINYKTETLFGKKIKFNTYSQFYVSFSDVFIFCQNKFKCVKDDPVIIDAGANIGIATLYMKRLYPKSKVIVIEPDPDNISNLEYNLAGLGQIIIIKGALSKEKGKKTFFRDITGNLSGGSLNKNQTNSAEIKVKTFLFSEIVDEEVDYFKCDIEGQESEVIQHISEHFSYRINQIYLEYHYNKRMPENRLSKIFDFFEKKGYQYHIEGGTQSPQINFRKNPTYGINVFAYLKPTLSLF